MRRMLAGLMRVVNTLVTNQAKKEANSNQGASNNKKRKWTANQGKKTEGRPPCGQCGKKHGGPCLAGKNVCFKCG